MGMTVDVVFVVVVLNVVVALGVVMGIRTGGLDVVG